MLGVMSSLITPLRELPPLDEGRLDRARELALGLARDQGHTPVLFPEICLFRFDEPTTFVKAATFGVTLGAVLQGTKRLRLGARELTMDARQLVVWTRDSEHEVSVLEASRRRPYLGLALCFGPERVARALLALTEAGGTPAREPAPFFALDWNADLTDAVERLLRALGDPLDRKLLAPLVVDEILFRLLRTDAAAAVRAGVGPAADAHRILEAMRFMRENHAEKMSVEQLARRSAMSASHFAHRFRAVARVSPMRFLREARLDAARARLLGSGARVSEVAVEVGFESPAHFTREFKRRFGFSPSRSLAALTLPRAT
jgi:AraC-like DNA-binding protein